MLLSQSNLLIPGYKHSDSDYRQIDERSERQVTERDKWDVRGKERENCKTVQDVLRSVFETVEMWNINKEKGKL